MRPYFEKMPTFGSQLTERQLENARESADEIKGVEDLLSARSLRRICYDITKPRDRSRRLTRRC